jgi:membrane-associated phospholipid phosphatase
MESETIKVFAILGIVFGTAIIIPVSLFWFDHRARIRSLDVLRVYAERGEEPPPSVVEALTPGPSWARKAETRPPTRAHHLSHAAGSTVLAAGLAGFTWWRFSMSGEADRLVVAGILFGLFFAAGAAGRLVGAYYAPNQ